MPLDPNALNQAAEFLRGAWTVAVLTGAGVSAESGVPTFRAAGGLWEGHRVEDVATPEAFQRDPALVWRFYNGRRSAVRKVAPNPGHHALVRLERYLGAERFTLITQNVDGLHARAGSKSVLELHGALARVRCTTCSLEEVRPPDEDLPDLPECRECGGLLRPDIVWFHEPLPEDTWLKAGRAAAMSECFLVVGTSAVVYPAAGLIDLAHATGAKVIEVNLEETAASDRADVSLFGPSGEVLPRLLDQAGIK